MSLAPPVDRLPPGHRAIQDTPPTGSSGESLAIEVDDLWKRYGDLEAVRGVSFDVGTDEVFGFLGPNGAGKTTTINVLCTLTRPTAGTARVAGVDVVRHHRLRPAR